MKNCKCCGEVVDHDTRLCAECTREGVEVPLDNVEFVTEMMEWSREGPLAQLFIITAIQKYADAVAKSTPAELGNMAMIAPEAWIRVAKEIAGKIDARMSQ